MSIQNYVDMTIESDIFTGARDSFDLMMQKLLHKMQQNASDEGSITLKVSVDMTTEWIPDGNGESEECFKPKIKYKVDYAVPVKEGQDGKKDPGMKLVYDAELRRYVLKYVNEGGQMSMFDSEFQEAEAEDVTESDIPAIEGPVSDQNALEKYGDFGIFLIDEHDNVIAGNQRLAILQRKDGDIEVLCKRLIGYTKSELRAINIKDNTHSGEWDLEELAKWTADLNIDLGVKLDNKDQSQKTIKEMELIRFEKYDYVLLVCRNELDYNELIRKLGIEGAKVSMGRNRTIKGRAIWYDQIKGQIVEGGTQDGKSDREDMAGETGNDGE